MVVALRYIFVTLWYCACILSCIDTHHFVYTSLSQTLYPSIIGLLLVIAFGAVCLFKKKIPTFNAIQIVALLLAAYILLHGTTIKDAELYKQGYTICTLLFMVGLGGLVRKELIGESHIENGIILISALNIAYLIAQLLCFTDSGDQFFQLSGANENPNIAAIALTISIPFIIRKIGQKKHIYLMATLLTLVVVFIITLKCRTAFVGVTSIIVCYAIISAKTRQFIQSKVKNWRWVLGIGMAVVLLSSIAYNWKKDSAVGRLFIWQRDCEMIAESPLGHGYGKYEAEYNLYQSRYFASHKDEYANSILTTACGSAYNDILEHGVQGGVIGGILYLAFLLLPVYQAYRTRKRYCLIALFAIVVMSISNSICYSISPWIMTISIAALLTKYDKSRVTNIAVRALCVFALILMSGLLLHREIQLATSQKLLKEYKEEGNHSIEEIRSLYPAIGTSEAYWRFLAECNENAENFKEADKCYTEARKYTSAPLLLYKSAMCKEKIGEKSSALEIMKTAVCMLPRNFSQKYHLMMMYGRMNDRQHERLIANDIVTTPEKFHNETIHFIKEEAERILNEQ